jgi:aldose sugar dehydrogenase
MGHPVTLISDSLTVLGTEPGGQRPVVPAIESRVPCGSRAPGNALRSKRGLGRDEPRRDTIGAVKGRSRAAPRAHAISVATLALGLLAVWLPASTPAVEPREFRSERHAFRVVVGVEGLEHPWGLAFLPDGRLLVTERPGRLRVIADSRLDPRPIGGLPRVAASGQGGLLDVALHPRYAETGWIYLAYAGPGEGGAGTEVLRGRLRDGQLVDVQVIFRLQPKSGSGQHFGSRLVFDPAGLLYVTLGDRGERHQAQRLDDHRGKILRLHDDGRVPADNPFGARPEIFSFGNRNVQGAALHPGTGALWTHEHGPQGGDEVNVIRAGQNYGWPVITFGRAYGTGFRIGEGTSRPDVAAPLHVWVPSIAPSGMAFYDGSGSRAGAATPSSGPSSTGPWSGSSWTVSASSARSACSRACSVASATSGPAPTATSTS